MAKNEAKVNETVETKKEKVQTPLQNLTAAANRLKRAIKLDESLKDELSPLIAILDAKRDVYRTAPKGKPMTPEKIASELAKAERKAARLKALQSTVS